MGQVGILVLGIEKDMIALDERGRVRNFEVASA
jgi:hypothetical protein